jgi:hypothetical protein
MTSEVKFERLPKEKAVIFSKLKMLEKVDESKFYRVTVQLGPLATWGSLKGSNKTIIHPKQNPMDEHERQKTEQVINVYSLLPVPGKEVNGLISETIKFKAENERHDRRSQPRVGDIRYMVAITEAEVIDHIPSNFSLMNGSMPVEFFKSIVQQMVNEGVATALATTKSAPTRPPKQDAQPPI